MQKLLLGLLSVVFLVVVAPTLMFALFAPYAMGTILVAWSTVVALATVIGGGIWVFAARAARLS
ncbi:hypothetical protein [Geoalkalibacter sp.]|uniref:hypothetical protein n=1 Tax=Geoalkalibacter sp. TaxID=3041440 RepID=UPI00272E5DA6|nr:hypothetical protein [Geoalkalibacter sp.]